MVYSVYAVRVIGGKKHRHYMNTRETLAEAQHLANCCVCGNADYAYVKEIGGSTVFFIRPPDYDEAVQLDRVRPILPLASQER